MEIKKVLLVEDEKSIQLITRVAIEKTSNIELHIVNNGQEALDHLTTWKPDLILMDVMMPVLTGPETLKVLKNDDTLKNLPVIFLTAKSEDDDIKSYLAQGAEGVLIKPFNPLKLLSEIEKILYRNKL